MISNSSSSRAAAPDVVAGDLQQVGDELLEVFEVRAEQVESHLGADRQLGLALAENLQRGGQGHQRRAQFVADVGGETGVALDAILQGRWPSG